jgi:hypothetical protein
MMLCILLWTTAGVLIAAFIATLSILCAPMRISIMFDTRTRPAFLFKLALFGGLLPVFSTADKQHERSKKGPTEAASRKPRISKRLNVAAFAARMLLEMPTLISKIFSRVKLERVDANIRFGLPDPADTGIVYGALIPILQLISVPERWNVVLHPDFGNQVFDGRGHMGARFVPVALIAPMLSFAWATMVLPRLSGVFR